MPRRHSCSAACSAATREVKVPTTVCIEASFVLPSRDAHGAQTWGGLRCLAPRRVLTHSSLCCSSMLQQLPCQAARLSIARNAEKGGIAPSPGGRGNRAALLFSGGATVDD